MTATTGLAQWIRLRPIIADHLANPRLTGDLLTLVLLMDLDYADHAGQKGWVNRVAEQHGGRGVQWVRDTIRHDIPRWEPDPDDWRNATCPVRGPRGGACHRPRRGDLRAIDPANGTWHTVRPCQRHFAQVHANCQALRQRWIANGAPDPKPNHGGVLPTLWDADWDHMYRWADPYATISHGTDPNGQPPHLRLIQGGQPDTKDTQP